MKGKGVTADELCARYPLLWHMAEDGTWPSIAANGLKSTSELLDFYGYTGRDRHKVESQHRASSHILDAAGLPPAVIRDQAPIHEPTLAGVLENGLTPADWYRILNERVFFWVSANRLDRLLQAKRYRGTAHTVVVVETEKLLGQCGPDVTLCPMNSGNTMMVAMPRGSDTFARLDTYPFHERRRAGLEPVAELAVTGSVDNVKTVAVRVERRAPGEAPTLLWQRP